MNIPTTSAQKYNANLSPIKPFISSQINECIIQNIPADTPSMIRKRSSLLIVTLRRFSIIYPRHTEVTGYTHEIFKTGTLYVYPSTKRKIKHKAKKLLCIELFSNCIYMSRPIVIFEKRIL